MFMFCLHSVVLFLSSSFFHHPLLAERTPFRRVKGRPATPKVKQTNKNWNQNLSPRLCDSILPLWSCITRLIRQLLTDLKMESETAASIRPRTESERDLNHSLWHRGEKKKKKRKNDRANQIIAKSALCKLGVCGSNCFSLFVWTGRQNRHNIP